MKTEAHVTQHWSVRKPAASGRKGIVVSQAHDASQAGLSVLVAGGNAADAAVATALALAAVEPWNSGLGGIGFALVYEPGGHEQGAVHVVDFGPVAPRGLDPRHYRLTGRGAVGQFGWPEVESDANIHGPLSVVIPSAPAGYEAIHRRWGRLPFAEVAAPAVALARRGLPADWFCLLKVGNAAAGLRAYDESARVYLPGGLPRALPYEGPAGFFRLGNLPGTMDLLAKRGLRDFYEGDIAAALTADFADAGCPIDAEDLRGCHAAFRRSEEAAWRGRNLHLTGGPTATPALRRVVAGMADALYGAAPDAAWFVAAARALRAAYAERLSPAGDGCTTHLTVCDADGMAVSMTTTLMSSFGSRMMLRRTGVMPNNGVMWFDPRPGNANSLGPARRPLCNMLPVMLCEGGRPMLAGGASGGRHILAAVFQVLTFIADFGMAPEDAAHHPRVDVTGADRVVADARLPAHVIDALAGEAAVDRVEHVALPASFACPNMIAFAPDGTRTGISDAQSPWSAALGEGVLRPPIPA
jgi:gamma-glutamyltranspeptidase / glutathione hydrolase